ncbi:TPA: hypothetical protein HA225_05940 [Candidatus Micrarchaeota archaeon]|nr:hypothetical protein [Candidatus Micrarchaeota archaeon]
MATTQKKPHSELLIYHPGMVTKSFSKMLHGRSFLNYDPKASEIFVTVKAQEKKDPRSLTSQELFSYLVKGMDENKDVLHPLFSVAASIEFLARSRNGNSAEIADLLKNNELDMRTFLDKHVKPKIKSIEDHISMMSKDSINIGKGGKMRIRGVFGG